MKTLKLRDLKAIIRETAKEVLLESPVDDPVLNATEERLNARMIDAVNKMLVEIEKDLEEFVEAADDMRHFGMEDEPENRGENYFENKMNDADERLSHIGRLRQMLKKMENDNRAVLRICQREFESKM